jgi:type I restriction enzyme S subunit
VDAHIAALKCAFANFMQRLRLDSSADSRYGFYLLNSSFGRDQLNYFGATTTGLRNLSATILAEVLFPGPPLLAQRAISDFLDKKTAAIDALIAKKERLIELLQEKRQALITQAVTKGLDPYVPMKDSGVEWLGEIPAHWRVLPIKRLARRGAKTFTDGDWIEAPYITNEGVRLLQTGNVGIGVFKEQGFRYVSEETFQALRCTPVEPGDVMICRLDGPVGRACSAPDLSCKVITSVDNAILKLSAEHDSRYVVNCLSLPRYLAWVQVLCRVGGGFRFRVSRSMLGEFRIPTPPRSEQERIADQLDRTTEASIRVERTLKASAERLREYRQAVITEAVTGKLDIAIAQEADRDPEVMVGQALEAVP